MKKFTALFLLAILSNSCIDDIDQIEEQFPQQWQLVRMTGSTDVSAHGGNHLQWREFYLLREDGSFLKSRLDDGVKTSATGTFTFEETEEYTRLILTYEAPNEIIGNCDDNLQETLLLLGSNLLIGTWSACDGPGLEYRRAN